MAGEITAAATADSAGFAATDAAAAVSGFVVDMTTDQTFER